MAHQPSPRGGHTTSIVSHYAIVFGGSNNELALNDTWALDLESGQWHSFSNGGACPAERYAHSATVLAANLIIFFGGFDSRKYYNDMHILDLSSRTWSKVEPLGDAMPCPRYAHSATLVGRQLLIFGGCGEEGLPLNDLWIFDLESLHWTQPLLQGPPPEPRSYHTASLIGDKLLIFGGKARRQWFSDVVMLDIPSRSWNPITLKNVGSEGPTGRAYHTATVVQDHLVCILGGYNGGQMCKHIALIDLASMSWLTYGKTDMLRCKHTTSLYNNTILVIGGHDGHSFLNSLARMDLDPLFDFVAANSPIVRAPTLQGPPAMNIQLATKDDRHLIDKENAIVFNSTGTHVRPDVLVDQVETLCASIQFLTSEQLAIMDDETLQKLRLVMQTAELQMADELEVRERQRARKKARNPVRFGDVKVREHKRAVGHGSVTSDGGPALGIDKQYADRLMRRLSSYENLRAQVRTPKEEFMKSGYKTPQEREALLSQSGINRTSIDLNMQESRRVKEDRKESSNCVAAVLISEAGLLPTTGNLKLV